MPPVNTCLSSQTSQLEKFTDMSNVPNVDTTCLPHDGLSQFYDHYNHSERNFRMNVGITRRHAITMMPDSLSDCPRCGGFMAPQDIRDYQVDPMWYLAQRCVNCGCIWDPVIGRHQRVAKARGRSRLKKTRPPRPFPQPTNLRGFFAKLPVSQAHTPLAST